ncbi:hypothetical protein WH87_04830 [Devosia epidermidihirudinis]|uniref:DUF4055 domain-containing protein n=1 Tax=Devosia epidermidihirudinis TaxID=1293439 RepID=A0A0F5QFK0_9HYPH|nr:DUF4055 domain-containing protein [Devosia epidermidihirudinis]KKC39521.1 hypothetical protein WH87_04830 [Devosia epidermidihirudinis]
MAFDITAKHPAYKEFEAAWTLMRDAFSGEDDIKAKGETYLPMKPGTRAISDPATRAAAYEFYKELAEFPDLLALTVRGAVGTMLDSSAEIELPSALEPLRERATRDGLTLEALHRRIATEIMLVGRYGVLPGIGPDGAPYLAGYVAESITSWDTDEDQRPDFLVLDESGLTRNPETGEWEQTVQYRECFVLEGRYAARVWVKGASGWEAGEPVEAVDRKRKPIDFLPFVFFGVSDLTPAPDDVPLYGLAKIARRIYRMDANYQTSLYMTSEPTPYVVGVFDEQNQAPSTIGAANIWVIPEGGSAGMVEFTGAGIQAQEKAIDNAKADATMFGAQLLTENKRTAESGEAIRLRLGNQTSTLKTIAMTSAAGLERALKNVAVWMGENPDAVSVKPNLDFFAHDLSAQDITAIVAGWQAKAYPRRTMFDRLKQGQLIGEDTSYEDYAAMLDTEMEDQHLTGEALDITKTTDEA